MRALIVDADRLLCDELRLHLGDAGVSTTLAHSGEDAFHLANVYNYDVILLELDLPDEAGRGLLKRFRSGKVQTPVIVIASDGAASTKIAALSAGADDYLVKPFDKDELVARIHAVVRRAAGHSQSVLRVGALTLNLANHRVEVAGEPVHLTGKEFQLMELLALRTGTTVSKTTALSHLYGGVDEPHARIVDVFVAKIRRKLMPHSADDLLQTDWGHGYVLRDPEGSRLAPIEGVLRRPRRADAQGERKQKVNIRMTGSR